MRVIRITKLSRFHYTSRKLAKTIECVFDLLKSWAVRHSTGYFIDHKRIACVAVNLHMVLSRDTKKRRLNATKIKCLYRSVFTTEARYKMFCAAHKGHSLRCQEILFIIKNERRWCRTYVSTLVFWCIVLYVISVSHSETGTWCPSFVILFYSECSFFWPVAVLAKVLLFVLALGRLSPSIFATSLNLFGLWEFCAPDCGCCAKSEWKTTTSHFDLNYNYECMHF